MGTGNSADRDAPASGPVDALVVGAGLAGVTAARELTRLGYSALVLERRDRPGGRCATRTMEGGVFDYGAQHFTVREKAFQDIVGEWQQQGAARVWCFGFAYADGVVERPGHPRWYGTNGMRWLVESLGKEVAVRCGAAVRRVMEQRGGWRVETSEGDIYEAKAVLMALPMPLAIRLISDEDTWRFGAALAPLLSVEYDSCFAAMLLLEGESGIPAPGAIKVDEDGIAWIADNRMKGISPAMDAVTVLADATWSRELLTMETEHAATLVAERAGRHLESKPARVWGYRWHYAMPTRLLPSEHFELYGRAPLLFAGDAFCDGKIEGAALSGLAAAKRLGELLEGTRFGVTGRK